MKRELALAAALLWCGPAAGEDKLISGPGATLTENKCKICHELQHIRRQPLSRDEWADNLRNMRERGAPMTDAEMAVILDYLATYYDREKPAPAPAPDTLVAGGANPAANLLNVHGCVGCHAPDRRIVGPSFKEIAARYAADPGAAERLAVKVRAGGKGAWGEIPMPPNPGLMEADAKTMVASILGRD